MSSPYKKAILDLFCNVARLISVCSIVHAFQVRVLKHPQKIGGIVISDKSDLTKITVKLCRRSCDLNHI